MPPTVAKSILDCKTAHGTVLVFFASFTGSIIIHSFFGCPLIHSPRREFSLLTQLESIFENGGSVEKFALLVARVREEKRLVNAYARYVLQVRDSEHREHWFRQLSSEALK